MGHVVPTEARGQWVLSAVPAHRGAQLPGGTGGPAGLTRGMREQGSRGQTPPLAGLWVRRPGVHLLLPPALRPSPALTLLFLNKLTPDLEGVGKDGSEFRAPWQGFLSGVPRC